MGIKGAVGLCFWAMLVVAPAYAQDDDQQDDDTQRDDSVADKDSDAKPAPNQGKAPGKKAPTKKDGGKQGANAQKPGGCVDVTTRARFASVGYDHIVTLKSACKKTMRCTVKTNVNPEPALVELAPGAEESVVTWRGSPARVFTPDVACE